jgi:hypothetical protein
MFLSSIEVIRNPRGADQYIRGVHPLDYLFLPLYSHVLTPYPLKLLFFLNISTFTNQLFQKVWSENKTKNTNISNALIHNIKLFT